MNTCIVIPRIVRAAGTRPAVYVRPAGLAGTHVAVELFMPHDPARPDLVAVWDGCHGTATLAYYREATKPPRDPWELEAADEMVRRYRAFMASIPEDARQPIERRERMPRGWRLVAWQ